ncbi:unnamed protein product [Anisakis simplex]|uniref:T-complex protein 1 subunit eta n=2 Tax=Anisakis simplex TaxID=6269 RepID=A0A0M3J3K2_ANISI|nr:unnamed protein product [Anisakis simplex]
MELSRHLKEMSGKIVGKEQFFWKAFARMFEIIPQQLCYNAGIDATDILNKLRHRHANGDKWSGVDINTESVRNNLDACIWEPALVKKNAIVAATEAACLVLSIDQTVKNPRAQSGGSMPGMPGQQ